MSYVDLIPSSNMFYGLAAQDYKKLVLEAVPSYANVVLSQNAVRYSISIAYAKPNEVVQWTASAEGYDTKTGTYTVTNSDTQTVPISLDVTQITTTIDPTPADSSVNISKTGSGTIAQGIGVISVTTDYGDEITYRVTHPNYGTELNTIETYENKTIKVTLTGYTLWVVAVDEYGSSIPDATISLSAPPYEPMDSRITVPGGTPVTYHIEATGYDTKEGVITVTSSKTEKITMSVSQITVGVSPTPSSASVQLSTTTATISGTGTTTTIVPYNTTVNYYVTDAVHGYISETGSVIAKTNTTIPVELTKQKVSLSIDPTPTTATVNLTADGVTSTTNNTIVDWGTEVVYDVSADHYITTIGTVTTESNTVIPVTLEKEKVHFTITPTGDGGVVLNSATVSISSTTTTVVGTTGVTGITVEYDTPVTYSVTNQGYVTTEGLAQVRNNENRTVQLTRTYAKFAIAPIPPDSTVTLSGTTSLVSGIGIQSITVPIDTSIGWEVKRYGYSSSSGSTLVASTTTIPVEIQPLQIPVTVTAVSSEGGSAVTDATISIADGTVSVSGTTGTATTTVPWGSTMTCNATATGYNSVINRTFKVNNTQAYTQYLTMIPQYEELTITAVPSTATITASYSTGTETAVGTLATSVRYGTVVNYEVSNEGFDTVTGTTGSIFESKTITVSLETTRVTLTVVPDPVDSIVKMSYDTVTQTATGTSVVTVDWNTTVAYEVSRTGYVTERGSIPSIRADRTVAVSLTAEMYTLTVLVTPVEADDAEVILTAIGYSQSGNTITVPYNTPVDYTVSKSGYQTKSGTYYVQNNVRLTVSLDEVGYFILTGNNGSIATYSSTGKWEQISGVGGFSTKFCDAAKGNSMFVVVGKNTGDIIIKYEGISYWYKNTAFSSSIARSIAYGKGLFVVADVEGYVYTSLDASTWSTVASEAFQSSEWHGTKFINNKFFLLGKGGIAYCNSDPTSGSNWSYVPFLSSASIIWYDIAYNNGIYVLSGSQGNIGYMDENFSSKSVEQLGSESWYSIAYGYSNFVLVGYNGVYYGQYSSSIGKVAWTEAVDGSYVVNCVAYGANKFIAVRDDFKFLESTDDGINWSVVNKKGASDTKWYGVIYAPS